MARSVQKVLQDYKALQDIIAILGMDELSEDDKMTGTLWPWLLRPPSGHALRARGSG